MYFTEPAVGKSTVFVSQTDRRRSRKPRAVTQAGERTGVHHTASVLGATEEEDTIRAAVLMGKRDRRVGCEKDTWGTHVKYSILHDSTGKMFQLIRR